MVACVILDTVAPEDDKVRSILPRCSMDDVEPDWWFDQESDLGFQKNPVQNRDQLRAALLCYECPLIKKCRNASWDEPAHVFGGLTAVERFHARDRGVVLDSGLAARQPYRRISPKALRAFLEGGTTDEAAATVNQSEGVTYLKLKRELAHRRQSVEGKWGTRVPPPPLPAGMTLQAFRDGGMIGPEFRPGLAPFESWKPRASA